VLTYEDILAFLDMRTPEEKAPARPGPPTSRREAAADARQPVRPAPEAASPPEPKARRPRRPLDLAA
jgi:hypothetical protein